MIWCFAPCSSTTLTGIERVSPLYSSAPLKPDPLQLRTDGASRNAPRFIVSGTTFRVIPEPTPPPQRTSYTGICSTDERTHAFGSVPRPTHTWEGSSQQTPVGVMTMRPSAAMRPRPMEHLQLERQRRARERAGTGFRWSRSSC